MANFCKACSESHFDRDFRDLAELATPGKVAAAHCDNCGPIRVDSDGRCVSRECWCQGEPGHGPLCVAASAEALTVLHSKG
jgi:hypothetical protein